MLDIIDERFKGLSLLSAVTSSIIPSVYGDVLLHDQSMLLGLLSIE